MLNQFQKQKSIKNFQNHKYHTTSFSCQTPKLMDDTWGFTFNGSVKCYWGLYILRFQLKSILLKVFLAFFQFSFFYIFKTALDFSTMLQVISISSNKTTAHASIGLTIDDFPLTMVDRELNFEGTAFDLKRWKNVILIASVHGDPKLTLDLWFLSMLSNTIIQIFIFLYSHLNLNSQGWGVLQRREIVVRKSWEGCDFISDQPWRTLDNQLFW